ncbi:MAG: anthranilate synthase component I family protein [Terracoccus sp.]
MDHARFARRQARLVTDVRHGADAMEAISGPGFWAVVATFEGAVTAVRFSDVVRGDAGDAGAGERGPAPWVPLDRHWDTSLDETAYVSAVEQVRERIAAGSVYQVNICRVLSHALQPEADLDGLDGILRQGNPAPYAARIRCADAGLDVVSASPELYLSRQGGRLVSSPIKGTAPTAAQMLPKDRAENVMIVDLVRNDLSAVCRPGTVRVDRLCDLEPHPGLVHLVSSVSGELRDEVAWPEVFAASFPPGSVSGAPKSSALAAIADLETAPRGPYCGAVGWVDGDTGEAELAVGIRTFWAEHDDRGRRWLRFGTGAGITWASDPAGEWVETELKAARLVGLAAGTVTP